MRGTRCACGHLKSAHRAYDDSGGERRRGLCAQLGCPCVAFALARDAERARILGKFRTLRGEILQTFIDIESWNDNGRKPHETPIDPDPGGELKRLVAAIDELLATDTGSGPIPALKWKQAR